MLLFSKFGLSCVLLCFDSHQLNCNGSLDDQLKIDTLLSYCSSYLIFFSIMNAFVRFLSLKKLWVLICFVLL